jgi:hypothetical protein
MVNLRMGIGGGCGGRDKETHVCELQLILLPFFQLRPVRVPATATRACTALACCAGKESICQWWDGGAGLERMIDPYMRVGQGGEEGRRGGSFVGMAEGRVLWWNGWHPCTRLCGGLLASWCGWKWWGALCLRAAAWPNGTCQRSLSLSHCARVTPGWLGRSGAGHRRYIAFRNALAQ